MATTHWTPRRCALAALTLSLALGATSACGPTEAPEPDAGTAQDRSPSGQAGGSAQTPAASRSDDGQPASAYTGPYDERFRAELSTYSGQRVSITGEVRDLIRSRSSYEIGDPADPGLDPLLISARYAVPEVAEGTRVTVTGTVQEAFEPPVVEETTDNDAEAGFYDQHVGEPYLDEAQVEAVESTGP